MNIYSYKDLFLRLGDHKILIFFESKDSEFDEISAFYKISIAFIKNIESFSNHFFNNSVSIDDNLNFQSIKNNIKKDFFYSKLELEKDKNFFYDKSIADKVLWNLTSQTCYVMVSKYLILNRFFRFKFIEKEIQTDSLDFVRNKIYKFMTDSIENRNYVYLAKNQQNIPPGFEMYVLCRENEFVGCYNDINTFKEKLKMYV